MSPEVKTALNIFGDISSASALVPTVVGLLRFRNLNTGLLAIFVLCIISILVDTANQFSSREYPFGLHLARVFTLAEFTTISIFFNHYASRDYLKKIIWFNFLLFIGIQVLDIYLQGFSGQDDLPMTFESVLNITYSMATFYFMIKDMQFINLLATPMFWILTAILIYFAGSMFVFATSNYAYSVSPDASRLIWGIHSLIHLGFNVLLTIGLWKAKPVSR